MTGRRESSVQRMDGGRAGRKEGWRDEGMKEGREGEWVDGPLVMTDSWH